MIRSNSFNIGEEDIGEVEEEEEAVVEVVGEDIIANGDIEVSFARLNLAAI